MPRERPEWIGKTDDTKIPDRVRQRIYDRAGGVCHYCSLPIKTGESWQADHVKALINGGEHRETNLAPIHRHCHVDKTGLDMRTKSKIAAVRARHTGVKQPKGTIAKRPKQDRPRPQKLPVTGMTELQRRYARTAQ